MLREGGSAFSRDNEFKREGVCGNSYSGEKVGWKWSKYSNKYMCYVIRSLIIKNKYVKTESLSMPVS